MPKGIAPLDLPDDVVQAAAARANDENRSLVEVTAALLREYAAGQSWINIPPPEVQGGGEYAELLTRRIREVHTSRWIDEPARRGMLTGLLTALELLRPAGQRRTLPAALQEVLDGG